MKKISDKRIQQLQAEAELTQRLLEKYRGTCGYCGQKPDWRGLSKHEKIPRSKGGDPTDENNTVLLCGFCHSKAHGIKEVKNGQEG